LAVPRKSKAAHLRFFSFVAKKLCPQPVLGQINEENPKSLKLFTIHNGYNGVLLFLREPTEHTYSLSHDWAHTTK
jgi:hypothetical protein